MGNVDQSLTIKVQAEVNKAKKQIEDLTKEVNDLSKATNDVAKSTKGIESLNKGFAKLGQTLKAVVGGLASTQVVAGAIDLAKVASEAEQADEAFQKMLETMGADAEKEFQKIKDASHGLIPDSALKQASANALQLGVPLADLSKLMELARAKSREFGIDIKKAFDGLVGSVAGLSPAMAESLGITIDLDKAYKEYAKTIGITADELTKQQKQMAFTNELLGNSTDSIKKFGDAELSAEENFKAFGVALENLKTEFGKTLLPLMNDLTKATTAWINSLDEKKLDGFKNKVEGVASGLKQVWEILGLINDVAYPDAFGLFGHKTLTNETSNLFGDELANTIQSWADAIDDLFYAEERLQTQNDVFNDLAKQINNFTGTADDFKILKQAVVDTLEYTNDMMNRWANSPNAEAYKDKIQPLQNLINALADAYTVLESKKPFEPKIKTADELAKSTDALAKATKEYTKTEIDALRSLYKDKLSEAKRSNASLLAEKKRLNKEILKADKDLAKELKKIANEKFQYENDLYNLIREAQQLTMSPYQKQADDQKRIAEDLANAKDALAKEELEKYKTYRAEYLRLGEEWAKKEIINGKEVERSKEEQQKRLLSLYGEDAKMQERYFDTLKQKAKDANELLKAQNKARIAGIDALVTAQKASIKIMEEFIKALTGKKIKIDTSEIDAFVKKMHQAQADVDLLTDKKKKLDIDSTTVDEANKKLEKTKQYLTLNGITAEIKADTTPAEFEIKKMKTTVENGEIKMTVNPEWVEAQKKIDEKKREEEAKPLKVPVEVDTNTGTMKDFEQFKRDVDEPHKFKVEPDLDKAKQETKKLITEIKDNKITMKVNTDWEKAHETNKKEEEAFKKEPIKKPVALDFEKDKKKFEDFIEETKKPSEHKIDVDNTQVEQAVAENKLPTSSIHTIYVRTEYVGSGGGGGGGDSWSKGGLIPQKLAVGGVFRGSGRVGGYDPFDTDGVNAYLTGGEYVINRRAVDLYGVKLLEAINKMKFMKPRGYAEGGLVQSTASQQQLRPIQLNIGGNSYDLLSPESVATALQRSLNEEGGF